MIDFVKTGDLPALQALWQTCFGDPADYVETFYRSSVYAPENTLVWREDGTPVSVVHMLPVWMRLDGEALPGQYIYAAATLPACRGRGLVSVLLEEACRLGKVRGQAFSCLVPGGPDLFAFYEARGYRTLFQRRRWIWSPAEGAAPVEELTVAACDFSTFAQRRAAMFGQRNRFVYWDVGQLEYIFSEIQGLSGKILKIEGKSRQGYAVCYKIKDSLVVKELGMQQDALEDAMQALCARFGVSRVEAFLPADTPRAPQSAELVGFGMCRFLQRDAQSGFENALHRDAPYMNLMLD